MTYRIEITTRDGERFGFGCDAGQDLLSAAADADITLPSQCRRGSCGACQATVVDGAYEMPPDSAGVLPAGQRGAVLLCRTTPRGDLRVAAPYDRTKVLLHPVPVRTARIAALETVAADTMRVELQIEPDDTFGSAAEFEPGQFAELEVPGSGVRRPYSLANTSNWDGRLEFLIRLRPGGWFSTYLRERARPGDPLTVRVPMGGFGLFADALVRRGRHGARTDPVDASAYGRISGDGRRAAVLRRQSGKRTVHARRVGALAGRPAAVARRSVRLAAGRGVERVARHTG